MLQTARNARYLEFVKLEGICVTEKSEPLGFVLYRICFWRNCPCLSCNLCIHCYEKTEHFPAIKEKSYQKYPLYVFSGLSDCKPWGISIRCAYVRIQYFVSRLIDFCINLSKLFAPVALCSFMNLKISLCFVNSLQCLNPWSRLSFV